MLLFIFVLVALAILYVAWAATRRPAARGGRRSDTGTSDYAGHSDITPFHVPPGTHATGYTSDSGGAYEPGAAGGGTWDASSAGSGDYQSVSGGGFGGGGDFGGAGAGGDFGGGDSGGGGGDGGGGGG